MMHDRLLSVAFNAKLFIRTKNTSQPQWTCSIALHTGLKLVNFTMCLPWFYPLTHQYSYNNSKALMLKVWSAQQTGKTHIAQPRFWLSYNFCFQLKMKCVCIHKHRSNLWTNKNNHCLPLLRDNTPRFDRMCIYDFNAREWAWAWIYIY